MQLRPQIMFQGQMTEALALWRGAFPDMTVTPLTPIKGDLQLADVTIAGQTLSVFDCPPMHDFTFTPSISLVVRCDTAAEVDRLYDYLSPDGQVMLPLDAYDFSPHFAWIADKFGLNWQLMQVPQ